MKSNQSPLFLSLLTVSVLCALFLLLPLADARTPDQFNKMTAQERLELREQIGQQQYARLEQQAQLELQRESQAKKQIAAKRNTDRVHTMNKRVSVNTDMRARAKASTNDDVTIARRIGEQKAQQARLRLQNADASLSDLRSKISTRRVALQDARQSAVRCRDDDSTECRRVHAEFTSNAALSLTNVLDAMSARLDKEISRVESSELLTDDQSERLVELLNDRNERVEELRVEAEAADSAADVRVVASQVAELRVQLKADINRLHKHQAAFKLQKTILRAESFIDRLQCAADAGVDVDVETYSSLVASSQTNLDEAVDAVFDDDATGARELFSQAQQDLREARAVAVTNLRIMSSSDVDLSACRESVSDDEQVDVVEQPEASEDVEESTDSEQEVAESDEQDSSLDESSNEDDSDVNVDVAVDAEVII